MAKTKSEIIDEVLLNDKEVAVALRRLADVIFDIAAYDSRPMRDVSLTNDEIAMAYRLIRELRDGIFHEATTPTEETWESA